MKHHNRKKSVALLVSVLVLVCAAVGGTIAFLMAQSGPVENVFKPSKVTTSVDETLEGGAKKDVKIKNTGDTEAWIRAAVVVTWQDNDGKVYGTAPGEADYTIDYGTENGWKKGADGFWYYTRPVAAGESTGVLIASCTSQGTAPEGYSLNVEIIGSGIQSKPASVFGTQWTSSGLKVDAAGTAIEGGA